MKQLNVMIKPASSLCNLRCRYCFYADEAKRRSNPFCGVMRSDTVERMLAGIASELHAGDAVHFIFQGGEPTLAGYETQKSGPFPSEQPVFSKQF